MHDRYIFPFKWVDYDIAVLDGCVFVEEEYVTSVHAWLHAPRKHDNNRRLRPESQLQYIPNHHCRHNDGPKGKSLVDELARY